MIWLFVRHVNRFVFGHIDQLQEFIIGRTERLVRVTLSICHNFVINYSACAAAIRRFFCASTATVGCWDNHYKRESSGKQKHFSLWCLYKVWLGLRNAGLGVCIQSSVRSKEKTVFSHCTENYIHCLKYHQHQIM